MLYVVNFNLRLLRFWATALWDIPIGNGAGGDFFICKHKLQNRGGGMSELFRGIVMLASLFLLWFCVNRLKKDTMNMELFEEGWELLQTEGAYITNEQREKLAERVYALSSARRYAVMDTIGVVVNLTSLMISGYFMFK